LKKYFFFMAAEALSYGVPIIGWPMAAEQF
jgi:UDP:flavonoid glycosyltransferase YjiC (YdhE family)